MSDYVKQLERQQLIQEAAVDANEHTLMSTATNQMLIDRVTGLLKSKRMKPSLIAFGILDHFRRMGTVTDPQKAVLCKLIAKYSTELIQPGG